MQMNLKDKIAFVTGGARGIGESIATILAAEGVRVVIGDIDAEVAKRTCTSIGAQASFIPLDVTKEDSINAAIRQTTNEVGEIDILVNNAGINQRMSILTTETEGWDAIFQVNTRGPFLLTRAVLPQMIKRKYGKIINIAAWMGQNPQPRFAHYSASKAALIAFTKAAAVEYAEFELNINCVCPGAVATRIWEPDNMKCKSGVAFNFEKDVLSDFALGAAQKREDVAHMVCYLSSDITKNISGQCFNVTS